jgi:nucleotide-binding universal stress UspA family protein
MKNLDIRRIAIPTDYSDTANVALSHAIQLAKHFSADITLIHVTEESAYSGIFTTSLSDYEQTEKAKLRLQEEAHRIEQEFGINVSQEVRSGRIYDQIVEAANDAGADMIVMGTHGVSGWAEFFAGSNAFRVVTQATCPVLTIQGHTGSEGFKNIIVPFDRTPETRQKVRYAAALAKKYGAKLHLASLLLEDSPAIRAEFAHKVKQVTDYLEREGIAHEENTLVGDNLANMTMNYAESKKGDLVVIMTEQEFNVTGFLVGPFAQQIVNHCKLPVLSISAEEGEGFHFN